MWYFCLPSSSHLHFKFPWYIDWPMINRFLRCFKGPEHPWIYLPSACTFRCVCLASLLCAAQCNLFLVWRTGFTDLPTNGPFSSFFWLVPPCSCWVCFSFHFLLYFFLPFSGPCCRFLSYHCCFPSWWMWAALSMQCRSSCDYYLVEKIIKAVLIIVFYIGGVIYIFWMYFTTKHPK